MFGVERQKSPFSRYWELADGRVELQTHARTIQTLNCVIAAPYYGDKWIGFMGLVLVWATR